MSKNNSELTAKSLVAIEIQTSHATRYREMGEEDATICMTFRNLDEAMKWYNFIQSKSQNF